MGQKTDGQSALRGQRATQGSRQPNSEPSSVVLSYRQRSQARPDRLTVEALAGRSSREVQGALSIRQMKKSDTKRSHPESHGGGSTGHPAAIRQTEEEYQSS